MYHNKIIVVKLCILKHTIKLKTPGIKRGIMEESRIRHCPAFREKHTRMTLVQPVYSFISIQLDNQPAIRDSRFLYICSLSFFFFLALFFLFSFIFFFTGRQTLYARQTRRRDTSCVCMRHVGAVPSSVVGLSAGWQGGCRPRRERGPRGTRRRTPRWFHAVKTVRFLQQLRIAAPPTTDIHIRAIRHSSGGVDGAGTSNGRKRGAWNRKEEGWNSRPGWSGMLETETTMFRRHRGSPEGKRGGQGWFPGEWSLFTRRARVPDFMENLSTD